MRKSLLLLFGLICIAINVNGKVWTVKTIPDPKNSPSKIFITDPDNLVDDSREAEINAVCWDLEQNTGVQFGIVIVHSIGDKVPKSFASELFNYWKIGKAEKNNGLLLMIVLDQKRWEFETGYGLEPDLPDATCRSLGENYLVPDFKLGFYGDGILETVTAVQSTLYEKYGIEITTNDTTREESQYEEVQNEFDTSEYYDYSSRYDANMDVMDDLMKTSKLAFIGKTFFLLTFPLSCLFIIWWYRTYKRKNKSETVKKYNIPKPNRFLFFTLIALPALVNLTGMFYADTFFDIRLTMIFLSFYISITLLLIENRMRFNRSILGSGSAIYTKYSSFRKIHEFWFIIAILFPVVFLPYYIWFRVKCNTLRKMDRPCGKCSSNMTYSQNVIEELKDDQYLSKGQIKEEYLTSRDWDVWMCTSCNHTEVMGYRAFFTSYDDCLKCGFITEKYLGSETITPATYNSSGTGKRKYQCQHCGNYREVLYTIPQKTRSSSGSGGSGGGGGSSWGGGSSGGGGAGGSW